MFIRAKKTSEQRDFKINTDTHTHNKIKFIRNAEQKQHRQNNFVGPMY